MSSLNRVFAATWAGGLVMLSAGAATAATVDATGDFRAWVVASGDNQNMPFLIIDKVAATVFAFSPDGQLLGADSVLVGSALGDQSAPGIGERRLADITPQERTTPAGRFVASLGADLGVHPVLWVDHAAALSLHRIAVGNVRERRSQRLASLTPLDNRISYGCINVTVAFFTDTVTPAFTGANGVVYILPEIRKLQEVFAAYRPTGEAAGAPGP